jgi:hypothetical protein
MKIAHPKTNIGKTLRAKPCFDFMTDSVAIKPGLRQQVVAEALKNIPKRSKRVFCSDPHWRARVASGQS